MTVVLKCQTQCPFTNTLLMLICIMSCLRLQFRYFIVDLLKQSCLRNGAHYQHTNGEPSQAELLTFFPSFATILLVIWSANGDGSAYFQGKFRGQIAK